ncbi:hypothetical protein ABEO75_01990 [Paenibacillus macerans]|uniref:hypothetical protein n=1 Tax=Paenibacillus macerans TaxID=44252 RepID=UPI002E23418D|nr:hypothetical protein [Paenibacillus macerans]
MAMLNIQLIFTVHDIPHLYVESAGAHDWNFWNKYIGPAIEWAIADPASATSMLP